MDKQTFEEKLEIYKQKAKEQLEEANKEKLYHKGMSKRQYDIIREQKKEIHRPVIDINSTKKEISIVETNSLHSTQILAQIEQNIQRQARACTVYNKKNDRKNTKELNNQSKPISVIQEHQDNININKDNQNIVNGNKINEEAQLRNKEKLSISNIDMPNDTLLKEKSSTPEISTVNNNLIISNVDIPSKETKTTPSIMSTSSKNVIEPITITNSNVNQKPKKTLTRRELDLEYSQDIEKNPMKLFDIISEEKIVYWKDKLKASFAITFTDDSAILNVQKDHLYQKVIINDCNRTRGRESILLPKFREYIELFLTYYCKKEGIEYKQGINEIAGPMLFLQYRLNISFSEIYSLIKSFINKFLTNYYKNQNLVALKSSLCILTILLKYHEPSVFNILEFAMITPEVYATSWILTTFASKCRLDVVYHLWDFLITHDDNLMMHFIVVSFFRYNKDKLYTEDPSFVPAVVCSLSIDSVEELDLILKTALTLRETTPYSFRILATNLELFKFDHPLLQQAFDVYRPDTITAMPFFPSEIFFNTYKGSINCPDERCVVMKILELEAANRTNRLEIGPFQSANFNENISHVCEHCDMNINKNIIYILLDLRILSFDLKNEAANDNTGFLPNMIMVPQEELILETFADDMTERFTNDKGLYHFVFLTSKTDYFKDFETNFYFENITEEEKKKMKFGYQTKIEKELNTNVTHSMTRKEKLKLKEYDNLKKLLVTFLKANYPYISYAYGGFNAIHDKSFKYDLSILDHDQKCILCTEAKKSKKPTVIKQLVKYYQRHKVQPNNTHQSDFNSDAVVKPIEPHFLLQINDIVEANLSLLMQTKEFFLTECNITHIKGSIQEIFVSSLLTINNFEIQIYILQGEAFNNSSLIFREKIMLSTLKGFESDKKKKKCDISLEDEQRYEIIFAFDDEVMNFLKLVKAGIGKKKK